MATFTARQATPGRQVVLVGSSPSGLMAPDLEGRAVSGPMVSTRTVKRWVPDTPGFAGLVDSRGQWCGIYGPDHLFADTAEEALALDPCHVHGCC